MSLSLLLLARRPNDCVPPGSEYRARVASFFLPTAMMASPTATVENASHVSEVPIATADPAPVHMAAMEVAMALPAKYIAH